MLELFLKISLEESVSIRTGFPSEDIKMSETSTGIVCECMVFKRFVCPSNIIDNNKYQLCLKFIYIPDNFQTLT